MSFLDPIKSAEIAQKLESLSKSFSAGYQGLSNAGRSGVSALALEQLDPVMRSITMEDKDFLLTKDIPTLKATQTVYDYRVKTAVRSGVDLAGFESFLPQEDHSQYIRVAEVLKVYGIRKTITQMAQLANDAGGYAVDLEEENDLNAALGMAEALERDLYVGGDYYNEASGEIDSLIASRFNGPVRNLRGIQANIREGDGSTRGIPGDYIAYGNNRSVVKDRKGDVLERKFLDSLVTAVKDSRGAIREGHCTTSQLAEFRATFFPIERADINSTYSINGAGVTNDEQARFSVQTVGGPLDFIPTVFKYNRLTPDMIVGSVGQMPNTPATSAVVASSTVTGAGFKKGQVFKYRVQAANVSGLSAASASIEYTVADGDEDKAVQLTITNAVGVEYYMVFRTPEESDGRAGTEFFCGKVLPTAAVGNTFFIDKNRLIPGLDTILFMPAGKERAKLATLGNLLNKQQLGLRGTANETIYTSYCGCVVDRPRTFGIADNVYEEREGL